MSVMGLDLSLGHGAAVELTRGKLSGWWIYTSTAGVDKKVGKEHSQRIPAEILKHPDKSTMQVLRVEWIGGWLFRLINDRVPTRSGIEGYAYGAAQQAHQLGELGGLVRQKLLQSLIPYRIHDPLSLKLFVAHSGLASKTDMEEAILERWGVHFDLAALDKKPGSKKQNRESAEDLADAYGLAMLMRIEMLLRAGKINLSSLAEQERRVFLRTTKPYPVNVLDRPFVSRHGIIGS